MISISFYATGQSLKKHHIITTGSLPNGVSSVNVADFNNDNEQDIVACSSLGHYIYYLESKGNQEFEILKELEFNLYELNEVKSADINNDGLMDIVFSRYDYFSQLGWLRNLGDNQFEMGDYIFSVSGAGWETVAFSLHDMNGDSCVDVVIGCNDSDYELEVKLNNGDGTFSYSTISVINEGELRSYQCIDFDNDGDTDLLYNSKEPYRLVAAINNGSAEFHERVVIDTNYTDQILRFHSFDSDGDSDNDIICITENDSILLFNNKGNDQFERIQIPNDSAFKLHEVRDIDIDKDGDLDIVSGYSDELIENTGDNIFKLKTLDHISIFSDGNKGADLNKNGIEDLVFGYYSGSIACIEDASLENLNDHKILTSQLFRPMYPAFEKINADEFPDICVSDNGFKYVFYLNNTLGEFSNSDTVSLNMLHEYSSKSPFFDIDMDGFCDVMSFYDQFHYNVIDTTSFIFARNNQDNTFTSIHQDNYNYLVDHTPYFNDYNNDSILDVFLLEDYHYSDTTTILVFKIDTNFTAYLQDTISLKLKIDISDLKFYDWDNNGQNDIFFNNEQSLFTCYSNNNFFSNNIDTIYNTSELIIDFVPVNINSDTLRDLIILTDNSINVLENYNGNSFQNTYKIYTSNLNYAIYADDINNNGIDEVFYLSDDTLSLLQFGENNTYSIENYYYNNQAYFFGDRSLVFTDIDSDGDKDILCTYYKESDLSWFENSFIDTLDYSKFPEKDAVWTEQNAIYEGNPPQTWTSLYITESDTTILDKSYTNIYEYYLNPNTFDTVRQLYASIRQNVLEKKVYIIRHYLSELNEKLLLDFKLNVGDTTLLDAYYWDLDPITTDSIFILDSTNTTIINNGEERDLLYLSNHNEQTPVSLTFIEGVGSIENPFGPATNLVNKDRATSTELCCPDYLICLSENDELVYVQSNESRCNMLEVWSNIETKIQKQFLKIYPNPTKDKINIEFFDKPISDFEIVLYNNHGSKLNHFYYKKNEQALTIDFNKYKSGIYLLRINSGNNSSSFKIVKNE